MSPSAAIPWESTPRLALAGWGVSAQGLGVNLAAASQTLPEIAGH
jgi:hypothetical protein